MAERASACGHEGHSEVLLVEGIVEVLFVEVLVLFVEVLSVEVLFVGEFSMTSTALASSPVISICLIMMSSSSESV